MNTDLRLVHLVSPSLPVGARSRSHALRGNAYQGCGKPLDSNQSALCIPTQNVGTSHRTNTFSFDSPLPSRERGRGRGGRFANHPPEPPHNQGQP